MRMICPRCGVPLQEQTRLGVLTDTCNRCNGVWLDQGELDRINARLRELRGNWEHDTGDSGDLIRWGRLVRYPRRHALRQLGRLGIYR
jgi:hypothetical protein